MINLREEWKTSGLRHYRKGYLAAILIVALLAIWVPSPAALVLDLFLLLMWHTERATAAGWNVHDSQ